MTSEVPWWISIAIGASSAATVKIVEKFVAHFLERGERTNVRRDTDVDALDRVIFEVRDAAKDYWLLTGRHPNLEGAISGRVFFIGARCDELFDRNVKFKREIQVLVNRFDQACTSGLFSSNARVAEATRCAQIEIAAYTLYDGIVRNRRRL
jgi:hypothetical protein